MLRKIIGNVFVAACLFPIAGLADSAPRNFSGTYKGDQILITIAGGGPEYTGTLEMGGKKYPLTEPCTARSWGVHSRLMGRHSNSTQP